MNPITRWRKKRRYLALYRKQEALMSKLSVAPCWCGLALVTVLHDTPHQDAGVQPVLECGVHGAWTDPKMVFRRLIETKVALGVQEARAEEAEVERDGLHEAIETVLREHWFSVPGHFVKTLEKALEGTK